MEQRFDTPGRVRLEIENAGGRIEVFTHDEPVTEVSVQAISVDAETLVERTRIAHRESSGGHVVTVAVPKRSVLGWLIRPEIEVRVQLPPDAQLEIVSETADVTATGRYTEGDVRTASGAVELDDCSGALRLRTASGTLRVGSVGDESRLDSASGDVVIGAAAGRLQTRTVSGDLEVARTEGPTTIHTVSGDVRLGLAGADLRVDSVSGDVRINCVGQGRVWAKTVSGDVSMGIAKGSVFHIDAISVSGDMSSEIPLEGHPDGGDDGPVVDVEIRTMSGDVHVARADADLAAL